MGNQPEMRDTQERPLPQNLEAEQSTLGSILLEPRKCMGRIGDLLRVDDFAREAHQLIYQGMKTLHDTRKPIDLITLGEYLQQRDELEMIGGTLYLQTLMAHTPTADAIEHYASIVIDKAKRRQTMRLGDKLTRAAGESDLPLEAIIQRLQVHLDTVQMRGKRSEGRLLHEWMYHALEEYKQADQSEQPPGWATDMEELNKNLDRFVGGTVTVIGGRPSTGKSVLAVQIGDTAAMQGAHVLMISLEMSGKSLGMRALHAKTNTPFYKTKGHHYRRNHAQEIYPAFEGAISAQAAHDFEIIAAREDLTPGSAMAYVIEKHHRTGIDMLIIDYLQLMEWPEETQNENIKVAKISRRMKQLALEANIPIILVSQLSRRVDERTPRRPVLSDLRESGAVEQDADTVLFLYRPGYYDDAEIKRAHRSPGDTHSTELIIAKQRNGNTGSCWEYFDMEHGRFLDTAPEKTG